MDNYLGEFKNIIRNSSYSNTYKMAWAKAIVELSCKEKETEEKIDIPLYDIAKCMIKYYWNQTIYFHLYQSAPSQPPAILTLVQKLIEEYQKDKQDFKPIAFLRAESQLKKKMPLLYEETIQNVIRKIKIYVITCFLNYNGESYPFYEIDKDDNKITFQKEDLRILHENQDDLLDLINYRWSLMLEDYNSSPRIGKKVRIPDDGENNRSQLKYFDEYLDLENEKHICFICGKEIEDKDLSRDHVIPWSYLYSDDLWNLVYVHKGCNSSKSNKIPNDEDIRKLKERNKKLFERLHEKYPTKNTKDIREFDYAVLNEEYIDKFYMGCKGC